jgi:hypothetical protein
MYYTLNGLDKTYDVVAFIKKMEAMGFAFVGLDPNNIRDDGTMVQRIELHNQPKFDGVCGPMYDGGGIRYETWDVYNAMFN